MIQLDFFDDNSELGVLKKEVSELKKSQDAVRRGMFARMSDLSKLYVQQTKTLERLTDDLERLREMLLR